MVLVLLSLRPTPYIFPGTNSLRPVSTYLQVSLIRLNIDQQNYIILYTGEVFSCKVLFLIQV